MAPRLSLGLNDFKMHPLEHPKSCSRRGAVQILQNSPVSSLSNLSVSFPTLSKLQKDRTWLEDGSNRAPRWLRDGWPNADSTRPDLPPAISGASNISEDFLHDVKIL